MVVVGAEDNAGQTSGKTVNRGSTVVQDHSSSPYVIQYISSHQILTMYIQSLHPVLSKVKRVVKAVVGPIVSVLPGPLPPYIGPVSRVGRKWCVAWRWRSLIQSRPPFIPRKIRRRGLQPQHVRHEASTHILHSSRIEPVIGHRIRGHGDRTKRLAMQVIRFLFAKCISSISFVSICIWILRKDIRRMWRKLHSMQQFPSTRCTGPNNLSQRQSSGIIAYPESD